MIFVLLTISVLAFFLCWNLISNQKISNITGVFFAILAILSVLAMLGNFKNHLGMEKETIVTRTEIVPVKQMMILKQPIGTDGTEQAVIYNQKANQKKPTVAKPTMDTKNLIKENAAKNQLVTKSTYWVYKNGFYKAMFGFAQKHELVKQTKTFAVKRGVLVMTPVQAKEFGAKMQAEAKAMQTPEAMAAAKAKGEEFVQSKLTAAMQKDPKMTDAQKQKLSKQYASEFQAQAKAQSMAQLSQKVAAEMNLK
ncbi:DUF4811 domain-containing protein [Fructilactobacillus frigidiflavus]|uniref:DUF4811 domain-containing protein n=1 Tax=Fructilactobacillus frigidiflavus TaxID=3242688 RepID=UPI0037573F1D